MEKIKRGLQNNYILLTIHDNINTLVRLEVIAEIKKIALTSNLS